MNPEIGKRLIRLQAVAGQVMTAELHEMRRMLTRMAGEVAELKRLVRGELRKGEPRPKRLSPERRKMAKQEAAHHSEM